MRTLRSSWGACRPRAEREEEQTGHRLTLLRSVRTVVLYVVKSVGTRGGASSECGLERRENNVRTSLFF